MPRSIPSRANSVLVLLTALAGCKADTTNQPPVADAGPDQVSSVHREVGPTGGVIDVFDPVTLDGAASVDPDDDRLIRFFWAFDTVPIGSALTHDALAPNADSTTSTSFTPDKEGIYGLTLQVFDGQMVSTKDYVRVEVMRTNGLPQARAGADLNGVVDSYATFDGTSSLDPDGDFLSYRWELVVVPPGSQLTALDLVYPATPNPRLLPDVEGVYALSLVVSDGLNESDPDFVTLTVATGNRSPVVQAGESLTITPCFENPITLDGSASYDPEGDPFSWRWSVLEVPFGSFVDDAALATPDQPTTTVRLDLYGLYVFGLTLDDGQSPPALGTVAMLYDNGSTQEAPQANAGSNRTARGQTTCTAEGCLPCELRLPLDGTGSEDPNRDPLTYAWSVIEGVGTFVDPAAPVAELIGPALTPAGAGRSLSATVRVQLVVSDCVTSSEPATATITFTCEGHEG